MTRSEDSSKDNSLGQRRYEPKGSPVDNDGWEHGKCYAVLEVKRVAFLVDTVEEQGILLGEVSTEEQTR